VNQVIRSTSSIAANFRAATRARSDAEFYSKICIVVEESDESLFWMEYLLRCRLLVQADCDNVVEELEQLTRLFNAIKSKMRVKIDAKSKMLNLRSDI
jgi:four helix bundle protein